MGGNAVVWVSPDLILMKDLSGTIFSPVSLMSKQWFFPLSPCTRTLTEDGEKSEVTASSGRDWIPSRPVR